ncbi:chemotaxis protein CheW [Archangium sp. Cb G35]|uniref:chemotaxis protein CheW n=1 Tax=Archangium sp. Cb G35 TaxID=1920190 RepID=UPI000936AB83|nr:chemotaxis protein CheW [Archangium sp. Cb G35]OJT17150.1 chemotaxis protein CheW [Archangium sp. Cb G35]
MSTNTNTATEVARPAQYLGFSLAGETYAIELLRIREIIEHVPITRVPGMPPAVLGVINLRGRVVPVVDLAVKMALGPRPITRWTCFVIVEALLDGERTTLGLLADSVSEVIDLGPDDIEPPPAFGTRTPVEYLRGMGRQEQRFILLLDLDRVLSTEELLGLAAAASNEGAGG